MRRLVAVMAILVTAMSAPEASAKPPLDAYADMPRIRNAALSPDGSMLAFISRINGVDYLTKYDLAAGKNEPLIKIPDIKVGGLRFLGSNYIILRAGRVTNNAGATRKYQDSAAFAYNLSTKSIVQLLTNTLGLYPYQSGLGSIAGVDPGGKHVFIPAYADHPGSQPTLDLYRVNLDTGRGGRIPGREGNSGTESWILDRNGNVVAREDYNEKTDLHQIFAYDAGGKTRQIFSETTEDPSFSLVGFSEREGALVAADDSGSGFTQLYEITLADGTLTGPVKEKAGANVETILRDANQVVLGVGYSGMFPSYQLFDPKLHQDVRNAFAAMPDAAISLASWTEDWSKILLYVEGGSQPVHYALFDRTTNKLSQVAQVRPDIKPGDLAEVVTVKYNARDGLPISALITWPPGTTADQRKNLPLVVMPHGGPESYDAVGYDWLAQFIANEGYVVLQPNFRGSGGFGAQFAQAGYKQWGRKMQDDITDGAGALAAMGWADPQKTCIVGWSYGGYAALAGGALTPDLYKCVASIAGVSDLPSMLGWEMRERGAESSAYAYWTSVIGDPEKDRVAIEAVSPSRLAKNFKAPVLLIHGSDDVTVPQRQSEIMEDALRDAGKQVTLLRIGKDDHGLTAPDSRNRALTEIAAFLKQHIGK